LYLLGMDYRRQLLLQLGTCWASPLLLVAPVVMGVAAAITRSFEYPIAVVVVVAAVRVFGAGCAEWPGLLIRPEAGWTRAGLALGLFLLILLSFCVLLFPVLGWPLSTRLFLVAGVSGLAGLAGIVYKLVRYDEATLREFLGR
jgi:hypothetical protein